MTSFNSVEETFSIYSINIGGGIRDKQKLKRIEDFLEKEKPDVLCLQEIKAAQESRAEESNPWFLKRLERRGYMGYIQWKTRTELREEMREKRKEELKRQVRETPNRPIASLIPENSTANGGLITLISNKWRGKAYQIRLRNERTLITRVEIREDLEFILVNVYAPADGAAPNNDFFVDLTKNLKEVMNGENKGKERKLIVTGDMNNVLDPEVDKLTPPKKKSNHNGMIKLLQELNLRDIWRKTHKQSKQFTCRKVKSGGEIQMSRIDRFYTSNEINSLKCQATISEFQKELSAEHAMIALKIKERFKPRGYDHSKYKRATRPRFD